MKINFEYLEMNVTNIGVICLVSMFPSGVMVLKLSKTVSFLQFSAEHSKKSLLRKFIKKFIKAIYI